VNSQASTISSGGSHFFVLKIIATFPLSSGDLLMIEMKYRMLISFVTGKVNFPL